MGLAPAAALRRYAVEDLNDDRPEMRELKAIMMGPLLMAGALCCTVLRCSAGRTAGHRRTGQDSPGPALPQSSAGPALSAVGSLHLGIFC